MNPRDVPNFYGYPSDIVCDLRPRWWHWLTVIPVALGAFLAAPRDFWRALRRMPLGQLECDVKESERR